MPIERVNGVDLHYLQAGEGDDVLLLCGLGDDVTAWSGQLGPFSERYRVTAVDNRGVGRSSLPDGEFTVRDLAADAIALCEAIGIGPAHVMGFSMGGAITQELAIARPDLARSLVIIGSWAYSDRLFRTFIKSPAYFAGIADDDRKSWHVLPRVDLLEGGVRGRPRRHVLRCDATNPHPQSTEAFQRTARAILGHDTRDRLGAVARPTLVLYGEEDVICPPRHSREIAGLIPGARLVGVPAQAHQPFQEDPAAFNETVLRFWTSL